MRMRRKKNLDRRLKSCVGLIFSIESEDKNFNTAIEEKEYIDLEKWFGNSNPVRLEVGCGKGQFAAEIAKRNPDINYIAVEKCANVVVIAAERAIEESIPNLRFIKGSAEYLPKYLPDGIFDRVYLNFSCPYPKNTYKNRRLTNPAFLGIYKRILKKGGKIYLKTDNRKFFEYSVVSFSSSGFRIDDLSLDLHADDYSDNIETEYEKMFSDRGMNIYYAEVTAIDEE